MRRPTFRTVMLAGVYDIKNLINKNKKPGLGEVTAGGRKIVEAAV
nr:hypothetical protein [uncultured Acetatifactor sp.]